jgi:predicted Rossmann fold nucleotide-binding protein DprA/Smf involved in DNA uptake
MLGPAGVSMDEFGAALGLHGSELLALLGRLELEGKVRREGDLVMPA